MNDKISVADQNDAQNTDKKEDKPLDPVAVLTLDLLDQAGPGGTLTPIDVAKAFAEPRRKANDPFDLWRRYLPAANQQARFLARQGKINILRRGEPVDPHKPIKGLIKLALPQA